VNPQINHAMMTSDPRWAAVVARDRSADGSFYYSVKTTGVYCRPSCAARLARPENVQFHTTAEEAVKAGFRPCKRCKPDRSRICFTIAQCSIGTVLVAATECGICAILLGDNPESLSRELEHRFPAAALTRAETGYEAQVAALLDAPGATLDVPLDPRGTPFQQRVWQALRDIPAGATATYADIAARIGAPGSVRAVAQACGANPIAIAIPCHRVVRSDGALSGYRWGVERKRALLDREARA
jgi:AraC family transcriptional regulator, regulatory protein of adaptative response / methylated-DNA-[protein]-cysteine methyltransferase